MELQTNESNISDKELALKKMALSQRQNEVVKLALSNKEERKQLWDRWKTKHPESRKIWRTDKTQSSRTLRCQVPLIIKRISATVQEQAASTEEENDEPAGLERTDSINSDISGMSGLRPT